MEFKPTLRRKRLSPILRNSLKEFRWHPSQLIAPLFVGEGLSSPQELKGLSGHFVHTQASALKYVERLIEKQIQQVIVFGVPNDKDSLAKNALNPKGVTPNLLSQLKKNFGSQIFSWVDVCLCSYTDTGHCGFMHDKGFVDNASTVDHLAQVALNYATAGADGVAPSDMMDGRVSAIRMSLDEARFSHVPIMSYAAKFASQFYGPFREAAQSTPATSADTGSPRANYQIDPAHETDALQSARRDVEEGADIIMVKPGLPYLDILRSLKDEQIGPLAVYQVSGEYASLKQLASQGYAKEWAIFDETMTSFLRSGAQLVLTYAAELLVDGGRS